MVETATDRSLLLADFGEAATWTPSGGSAATLTALLSKEHEEVDTGGAVAIVMSHPRVTCRTADVSTAAEGDTFAIGGVTYTVRVVMTDGTGMTQLVLEAP